MVLVALMLACEQPQMGDLPPLDCTRSVESHGWSETFNGQLPSLLRDDLVADYVFESPDPEGLWSEIGLSLKEAETDPVRISWSGEGCPDEQLALPLKGTYTVWGAERSPCWAVLDSFGLLRCAGALDDNKELKDAIMEELGLADQGSGYFVGPPLILEWDTNTSSARAELWVQTTEQMVSYTQHQLFFEDLVLQTQ